MLLSNYFSTNSSSSSYTMSRAAGEIVLPGVGCSVGAGALAIEGAGYWAIICSGVSS